MNNVILSAAKKARLSAEIKCVDESGGVAGQCFSASEMIYDELSRKGFGPTIVSGVFKWGRRRSEDHTWIEVDGMIVDVTADQFDKRFPKIWIDAPKKHYVEGSRYFFEIEAEKILRDLK